MPLDLVGKLHRTVYVCDCAEDAREDLVRLMMQRCGAVEAWDVVEDRVVVVLASINSLSTALSFNGMSFVDLSKKIIVWKATEAPPAAVQTRQLAIAATTAAPAEPSTIQGMTREEWEQRREARKQRMATLQTALGIEMARVDLSVPANRDAKLNELCLRQLRALCVLTQHRVDQLEEEVKLKEHIAEVMKSATAASRPTERKVTELSGGKRARE
ncbi:hypothetical protein STCU_04655 [Strigomonas culicis]|uniref:Uncharacterized protein n=1 Tax=Strigomonas culicis TaxID=28005 RepID=S9UKD4_9TRYP|nr:hypothetical protein STCU_04655 [Strigomonas culicis]|eukprot:EPY29239.1 hypothetical protein STCU_04655 [Strigomonas culicis]